MSDHDIIVIGAGIAGASVAAHLAETHRVALLEREPRPGYHSTGRSAAQFTAIYGNPVIRALTRASRQFLFEPPPGFAEAPLIRPRGCLYIATAAQIESLQRFAALPDIAPATRALSLLEAHALCPVLREDYVAAALFEPDSCDIDVHGLHQGYLRVFRSRGGELRNDMVVAGLERTQGRWQVSVGHDTLRAAIIVDAAGAWADEVAALAGVARVGLSACRRTAVLIDPPAGMQIADWPFVTDADEQFYFKPEAGQIFLSPADETPTEPCDVQPEEWDIAAAVDRVECATTLKIQRLRSRWAGLRTFAPDRSPVVGFSRATEGFFWLAGQGGYGIQTAPALSRAAAAMLRGLPLPRDLELAGIALEDMSPARF